MRARYATFAELLTTKSELSGFWNLTKAICGVTPTCDLPVSSGICMKMDMINTCSLAFTSFAVQTRSQLARCEQGLLAQRLATNSTLCYACHP